MPDHYKTLGVSRDASSQEIKKTFRTLAKKVHPDRNAQKSEWATRQMKQLLEANRVLSNSKRREMYDRKHYAMHGSPVVRRAKPFRDPSDPMVQAEGILNDLLGGNQKRGIETYERLTREWRRFRLTDHLELRDWVDCKFLLAEQYEKKAMPEKAVALYEEVCGSEQAQRRYAHLVNEVRDRMLRLYSKVLAPAASPEAAAGYYLRALSLDLSRTQRAYLHKKLAECHLGLGDAVSAQRQLGIALKLSPNLKGTKKVCQKLGFTLDIPAAR